MSPFAPIDIRYVVEKRDIGSRAGYQKAGIGIGTQCRRKPFVVVVTLASFAKAEAICASRSEDGDSWHLLRLVEFDPASEISLAHGALVH
jgi:hypothetical protein